MWFCGFTRKSQFNRFWQENLFLVLTSKRDFGFLTRHLSWQRRNLYFGQRHMFQSHKGLLHIGRGRLLHCLPFRQDGILLMDHGRIMKFFRGKIGIIYWKVLIDWWWPEILELVCHLFIQKWKHSYEECNVWGVYISFKSHLQHVVLNWWRWFRNQKIYQHLQAIWKISRS